MLIASLAGNLGLTTIAGKVTCRRCVRRQQRKQGHGINGDLIMKLTDRELAAIWQRIRDKQLTDADMAIMVEEVIFIPSITKKIKTAKTGISLVFPISFFQTQYQKHPE